MSTESMIERAAKDHDLLNTVMRVRRENEARTPLEWVDIASDAVRELRSGLSRAIQLGNADVPPDSPAPPASAMVTASFVHVGKLVHALEWLERALRASASDEDGTPQEVR